MFGSSELMFSNHLWTSLCELDLHPCSLATTAAPIERGTSVIKGKQTCVKISVVPVDLQDKEQTAEALSVGVDPARG